MCRSAGSNKREVPGIIMSSESMSAEKVKLAIRASNARAASQRSEIGGLFWSCVGVGMYSDVIASYT